MRLRLDALREELQTRDLEIQAQRDAINTMAAVMGELCDAKREQGEAERKRSECTFTFLRVDAIMELAASKPAGRGVLSSTALPVYQELLQHDGSREELAAAAPCLEQGLRRVLHAVWCGQRARA